MCKEILKGLEPERVFYYFERLASIPHGSGNTRQISDFCVNFATEHNLEYYRDNLNNVIIIKPATAGRDNEEPIIIQGHMDMVCEKAPGCNKDMNSEGLELFVDGDLVGARDTTLGGDDGIAVAMALAILEDNELSHPRLEAIFTVDEETGMYGAAGIDVSMLKGHTMLNIDSEKEGIFTVSCAGGVRTECILPVKRKQTDSQIFRLHLKGLTGGHSGIEINRGRATSNKLMAVILNKLYEEHPFRLVSVKGGLKDNAIPADTVAILACNETVETLKAAVDEIAGLLFRPYKYTDPNMSISVTECDCDMEPMVTDITENALRLLYVLPEGIVKMSSDVEGLVQTSLNMGILNTTKDELVFSYCVRSSVDEEKQALVSSMKDTVTGFGGRVENYGDYNGWKYRKDSVLREVCLNTYRDLFHKDAEIEAVHAGVECGIFSGKIPNLDCISYGPDLFEIHTCRERMSISSVKRVYDMTRTIIERGVR